MGWAWVGGRGRGGIGCKSNARRRKTNICVRQSPIMVCQPVGRIAGRQQHAGSLVGSLKRNRAHNAWKTGVCCLGEGRSWGKTAWQARRWEERWVMVCPNLLQAFYGTGKGREKDTGKLGSLSPS